MWHSWPSPNNGFPAVCVYVFGHYCCSIQLLLIDSDQPLQNIPLIYFSKPDGLQLFAPFLISSFSFIFFIFFIFVTFTCFRSSQQALILEKDDPNKYTMQFLNEQSPTLCLWKSLICSFCFEAGDWFASCNEYASLYGRPG